MAIVNIPLEIPADCLWDTDELVERIRDYARSIVAMVPKRQCAYDTEDLFKIVEAGEKEIAAGGGYCMAGDETGRDFINRLLCTP